MFNHHLSYSPDFAPSDFHLFLHLKEFLSGQRQRFQNDKEAEMSVTWFQFQVAGFYDSWSQDMTNISIPEVNMFKNSSTLPLSVPINLSIIWVCSCKRPQGNLMCGSGKMTTRDQARDNLHSDQRHVKIVLMMNFFLRNYF